MKSPLTYAFAALLTASGTSLALAQQGTPIESQPTLNQVEEPAASVSRPDELANAIAQAINADASLKGSKITVQPDDNSILLTGSTSTEAQKLRAGKIAAAHAGTLPVVNTTASSEVVIWVPVSEKQRDEQVSAEAPSDQPTQAKE